MFLTLFLSLLYCDPCCLLSPLRNVTSDAQVTDKPSPFCLPSLTSSLATSKTALYALSPSHRSFTIANPYSALSKSSYINRTAVKLANLDYLFKLVAKDCVFVDLCAGPGGFVEYIVEKTEGRCEGYAITLSGVQVWILVIK